MTTGKGGDVAGEVSTVRSSLFLLLDVLYDTVFRLPHGVPMAFPPAATQTSLLCMYTCTLYTCTAGARLGQKGTDVGPLLLLHKPIGSGKEEEKSRKRKERRRKEEMEMEMGEKRSLDYVGHRQCAGADTRWVLRMAVKVQKG